MKTSSEMNVKTIFPDAILYGGWRGKQEMLEVFTTGLRRVSIGLGSTKENAWEDAELNLNDLSSAFTQLS